MQVRPMLPAVICCAAIGSLFLAGAAAQTGRAQAPSRGTPAPAARGRGTAQPRAQGTLLQVMRGILYPASNVIFAAQSDDPAAIKPAADPATSPNPLTSSYGGWNAVENSGIALAEAANLLTIPGRRCSNGKPAPIQNADWQMWVQELRAAGMAAYKAAQAKNQDAILDAAGTVSEACSHCHDKYREVPGGVANRC
jgi:Cytochrome C'